MIGSVKWFSAGKGYGFIQPDDGSPDAFVHVSAVESSGLDNLNAGQRVAYDLETDPRSGRTRAVNLAAG